MRSWTPKTKLPDFLEWESHQPDRWELIEGMSHRVPAGEDAHEQLLDALVGRIHAQLDSRRYTVMSRARVLTPHGDALFPDFVITAADAPPGPTSIAETLVVGEVLSGSTEGLDRGRKWHAVRTIPSVQHYVLGDPAENRLEVYSRGRDWRYAVVEAGDVLHLPAVDVTFDWS